MPRIHKVSASDDAVLVHSTDRVWPQKLTLLEVTQGLRMRTYYLCLSFKYGSDAQFHFCVESRNRRAAEARAIQALQGLIGVPRDAVKASRFTPQRIRLEIPIFYLCAAYDHKPPKDYLGVQSVTRLFDAWGNEIQLAPIEHWERSYHYRYEYDPAMGLCPGLYWEVAWMEDYWPPMLDMPSQEAVE